MSTESNKALIRRGFEEGINHRKLDTFADVVAPSYVNHNMPIPTRGPEGFRQVIGAFLEAFPDMRIQVDQVIGEADTVATRGSFRGTHKGAFMGIPATGKPVEVAYIDFWRFEGGKAVENWVQMDMLGMMQQLGVVPAPGK
jgi:steroid delta-isomerase-like uncharacterized protein